jgi:RND family efflux transporter MFP subunit
MPSLPVPAKPGRTWIKRRSNIWGVAPLVILLGGSSWWLTRGGAAHRIEPGAVGAPVAADTGSGAAAMKVDVVKPRIGGLVRRTVQPGSVHAFESVDIFSKVSGFLKTQDVDIGAVVKRGDVLAVIDVPELEKDVEEADAAVEQAKARAALAEARVSVALAEREAAAAALVQSEADIAQQVAKRTLSEKQLERIKGLHGLNAIAREVVDEHEHDVEAAKAGERSARAAALTSNAQVAAAAAKVQQAKADVAEAQSAIRLAEARLQRTRVIVDFSRIVAPFDGVVTARNFHPGAFIRSAVEGSAVPLLTVMRTDRMRVVVQVPDLDVALLDVGDPAVVVIDALKGRSFPGAISRVARAENPTTRTMRIEVDLENPAGLLCEGMYGRATIDLRPPSNSLTVPASCVLGHSPGGLARVFVAREGRVKSAAVSLGGDDGTTTEVLSGLEPDDEVVLNPRSVLDENAPVLVNLVPGGDATR